MIGRRLVDILGAGAAADHVRRCRRRPGNPARRRQRRLRHGAPPQQRPARGHPAARRRARDLALRHRADRHALRHHRLRGADPRLCLPLAGDARARGRPDLRHRAQPHRHRAQPRPLRPVGLGPRARPHLLVAFDVRDPRPAAARRAAELRRGQTRWSIPTTCISTSSPPQLADANANFDRPRFPHAPRQRQLGLAARALRAGAPAAATAART